MAETRNVDSIRLATDKETKLNQNKQYLAAEQVQIYSTV